MTQRHSKKRILICPLDWGLGHATRCIPIINELLKRGCEVCIASSGQALSLLRNEFPQLTFDELPPYNVRYYSSLPMTFSMGWQLPKLMKVVRDEHLVLEQIIERRKIDLIISDNRYGCWSDTVKSVFITHQINIKVPSYLNKLVNDFNAKLIAKFSFCWIPDVEGDNSLAGELSRTTNPKARYIGLLSRFQKVKQIKTEYDILAILSGPEPQRKLFEGLLRLELVRSGKKCLLVKGIPPDSTIQQKEIDEVDFLGAAEISRLIQASEIIVCRSGYSTIMDLVQLGKKAILVPTLGQTEQEYLAASLKEKGVMFSENQKSFNLQKAINEYKNYNNELVLLNSTDLFNEAIDEVL